MLIFLSGNFISFSSEVHKIHWKIMFKKKTRLGEDERRWVSPGRGIGVTSPWRCSQVSPEQ